MKLKAKSYFIKTFGCQMNHSDSERIAGFLEMEGLKETENINSANIVVFNTCGVRQMAEDRVYGQIHNIRKKEVGSKKKVIILTGCLANRKDVQGRLKNKVDLFFPINDFKKFENWVIENLLKIVNCKLKISAQKNIRPTQENIFYLSINPKYTHTHTAYVPIMTGCNNFCSYCVVPYARGREVSRPAEEIISEVKNLVKKGCKEIILLGQNVNSYHGTWNIEHETKNKEINFSKLLKELNKISGNFWIWFVSNHPKDFSSELIQTATKCRKVCECIHLPIQAGDDKILARMNRKYNAKEYLNLIAKVKKAFEKNKPGKLYSITSDIIVGFPGETKKQFLESAKLMEKVGYDMVFFGQFSPRPGTVAWKMKDSVSKKEKVRRENYLNEILKYTVFENNKKYLGKVIEVLVDKIDQRDTPCPIGHGVSKDIIYFGHTRTMKNVKIITKNKNLIGKIIKVKIIKANVWNLEAEITK